MDIRQLRYFLRVAELRSFTRAAEDLRVAQPALSRQVKLLEEEFGQRLLHRHGRGVTLTEAGAELQARSSGLVADFDRLTQDMHARAGGKSPQGSITLGVPISISRQVTMPILTRCRAALPGVAVRVVEGHSEMIADWLTSGRVELALLYGDHPRRMIAADILKREDIVAVASSDAPWAELASITRRDLERIPLVLPRRPHATWAMLDTAAIHPVRVIEADTLLEMLQHVHEGAGVTLLAAGAVAQEQAAGTIRIIPLAPPGLSRALVLGRATNHPLPSAAEAVAALIRSEFEVLVDT
jgi:LysR family nitrogen assimilation transcriptional regulator